MTADPDFKADLLRYPNRPFLREQSVWAIYVYRYGRRALAAQPGLSRTLRLKLHGAMFRIVSTITGIVLPPETRIGPGLRIYHFGSIFLHSDAHLGRNCTLRQGVTIGNRIDGGPAPTIGDDVEFGPYAQVLGGVRVGNRARIGPLSVVLQDVPAGATALGVPAKILPGSNQLR